MDKKAKIIFAGDYFPGWQSSMNLRERLSYLTKSSYLSYSDRVQMINTIALNFNNFSLGVKQTYFQISRLFILGSISKIVW